ncbi:hypothetical protein [Actinoplanes sp. M2I2]|uniref:hypothetical protein n=1 Tax=Actinoplanes sp. M2I2 TaxID=1734444 RepID=UPI002021E526|nr:hypothetical protein [Actinoplanes sp. M2I2]
MTPWWANLISVAIGALVGGGASLWGVKIVQDRTDAREHHRIDVENERERRKLASERPSRLRPDRIAVLYEIGNLLHNIDGSLAILFDRSEHDESYDWDSVAAQAAGHASTARLMDIRVRLLFQGDELVDEWRRLDAALAGLESVVDHGYQLVPADPLTEENERQVWGLIVDAGRKIETAAADAYTAIRTAMSKIDNE